MSVLSLLAVLQCYTTNGVSPGNTIENVPVQSSLLAYVHSWLVKVAGSFH